MAKIKLKKPKYQQGGASSIYVPVYEPFARNWVSPTIEAPKAAPISTGAGMEAPKKVEVPMPDFAQIEKLAGKGHRNDVDAYIAEKMKLRDLLQSRVNLYGPAYAETPEYKMLVQKLLNNPAEINQLAVRWEMSAKNAEINKQNGGENEFVTNEKGQVFAKKGDGTYAFVDRYLVSAGLATPISSSEAIQLNDVDPALTKSNNISTAIAQTWGGEKTMEFVEGFIKNIGEDKWLKASEQFEGVGKVDDTNTLLFGETGTERGGSTNIRELMSLLRALESAMPTGARNYYMNKAMTQVAAPDLTGKSKQEAEQEYTLYTNKIRALATQMVMDHVFKALKTDKMSKTTVSYDATYTANKSFGVGEGSKPKTGALTIEQHIKDVDFLLFDKDGNPILNPKSVLGKDNVQIGKKDIMVDGKIQTTNVAIFPLSEETYENVRTASPGTKSADVSVLVDGANFKIPGGVIYTNIPGRVVEEHLPRTDGQPGKEARKRLEESVIVDKKDLEQSNISLITADPDKNQKVRTNVVEKGTFYGTNINSNVERTHNEQGTGVLVKITPMEAAVAMGKTPKDEAEAEKIITAYGKDPDNLFRLKVSKDYDIASSGQKNVEEQKVETGAWQVIGGNNILAGEKTTVRNPYGNQVTPDTGITVKENNAYDSAADVLNQLINSGN